MPFFSKICQEKQNKSLTKIQTVKVLIVFPSIEKKIGFPFAIYLNVKLLLYTPLTFFHSRSNQSFTDILRNSLKVLFGYLETAISSQKPPSIQVKEKILSSTMFHTCHPALTDPVE